MKYHLLSKERTSRSFFPIFAHGDEIAAEIFNIRSYTASLQAEWEAVRGACSSGLGLAGGASASARS